MDTIIENFCINKDKPKLKCNGKCYLLTQIGTSSNTEHKSENISIKEIFLPCYFETKKIDLKAEVTFFDYNNSINNWGLKNLVVYEVLQNIDRPPQKVKNYSKLQYL